MMLARSVEERGTLGEIGLNSVFGSMNQIL